MKFISNNNLVYLWQGIKSYIASILNDNNQELKHYIHDAIYGIIDGTIEHISNTKATYIRDYSFYQHQSLITAEFPNVTDIGDYAFYKCPVLSSVIASLTTNIGTFSFKGCANIAFIDFPLVTTIGQGCFDECTTLSSVNLPLITRIEPLTFRKCEALTSIDLPVATSIGTQAFYSSGITSLTLSSLTVCTLENADAFYFTPIEEGTGQIFVPSGLVDDYKIADGWSVYANQIRAIE